MRSRGHVTRAEIDGAENGERPGWRTWPEGPCAAPGRPERADGPPPIDLLALASRSISSHRPSCSRARRAMPLVRPGHRLPGSLTARTLAVHADPVARPIDPGDVGASAPSASWGGDRCIRSDRPSVTPDRSVARCARPVVARPAPSLPLHLELPLSAAPSPGGHVRQALDLEPERSFPVRHALSRTRNPWSRGIFESPGLSPELLVASTGFLVHPPFMHNVTHSSSRLAAGPA